MSGSNLPEFPAAVIEEMRFLEDLGLHVAMTAPLIVRFANQQVVLDVSLGRGSGALSIEIARRDRDERYNLAEILGAFSPSDAALAGRQVRTEIVLRRFLREIAKVLSTSARSALAGDPSAFTQLGRAAAPGRDNATQAATYGAILDRADHAWDEHDREAAADLYESAFPALDATRRRRLAFMRR